MKGKLNITKLLVNVIAICYIFQLTFLSFQSLLWLSSSGIERGEYYRLFTVALLHGGLWHLAFNLLALYALGTPLENYFGKGRYLLILFFSLICGSTLSVLLNPAYVYSIGASGMIFGLFGALALVGEKAGVEWRLILIIVGLNFAIGFVLGGVDWRGHLGGLIGGALIALVLNRRD